MRADSPPQRGAEARMVPADRPRSYYGLPIVKRPTWTWEVPVYFFTGGTAGALAALSAFARWTGRRELGRRSRRLALLGAAVSPALLISDLGRPQRFLNMLRVLRPTSPMSLGSWTLAGFGGVLALAELADLARLPEFIAGTLEGGPAILGPILTNYTAVLLGDTANPSWRAGRAFLPFVFSGSSLSAAGGALCCANPGADATESRRLVLAGVAVETAAFTLMERRLGDLARPYNSGRAGTFSRLQRGASLGAVALLVSAGRRSRAARFFGGGLAMASSLALRECVYHAGFAAAENPDYLVSNQS